MLDAINKIVPTAYLDIRDEEAVLRKYDALAHRIARGYHPKVSAAYEMEELVQQARMGILEAARSFDESRGVKFITHAYNSAWHSVSRYIRKNPGLLRSTNPERDGVPTILPLFTSIVASENTHNKIEQTVLLDELLNCLDPDEREVCIKMNCEGMSARETAMTMENTTSYRVLMLNRSALAKLREYATKTELEF